MLTANEVRSKLAYNPLTGIFVWAANVGRSVHIGDRAGALDCYGYAVIRLNRTSHKAHRLAWLYVYGEMPGMQIDHINGERADNRICNLRLASGSENTRNSRRHADNSAGFKGVVLQKNSKRNPWRAMITFGGVTHHLGNFDTPEKAHAAYVEAASLHYGEFARAA